MKKIRFDIITLSFVSTILSFLILVYKFFILSKPCQSTLYNYCNIDKQVSSYNTALIVMILISLVLGLGATSKQNSKKVGIVVVILTLLLWGIAYTFFFGGGNWNWSIGTV